MEHSRDSTVQTLQRIFKYTLLGIGFVMFVVLAGRGLGTASEPRYVEGQPRSWKEMFVGLAATDLNNPGHSLESLTGIDIPTHSNEAVRSDSPESSTSRQQHEKAQAQTTSVQNEVQKVQRTSHDSLEGPSQKAAHSETRRESKQSHKPDKTDKNKKSKAVQSAKPGAANGHDKASKKQN